MSGIEALRTDIDALRTDMNERADRIEAGLSLLRRDVMARIDRMQDALTLGREEQLVDTATVLLLRRQMTYLLDRVQALEERDDRRDRIPGTDRGG